MQSKFLPRLALTRIFIKKWLEAEERHSSAPLLDLFEGSADFLIWSGIPSIASIGSFEEYWQMRHYQVARVTSQFHRIHEGEDFSALECRSVGALKSGSEISRAECIILEMNDEKSKITRMASYGT